MYTPKEARPRLVIQEAPPKGKKMAVRDYSPDGQIKMFTADVLGYKVRSSDTFSSAYNVLSQPFFSGDHDREGGRETEAILKPPGRV